MYFSGHCTRFAPACCDACVGAEVRYNMKEGGEVDSGLLCNAIGVVHLIVEQIQ